jgi:hypothetical protein
MEPRGVGRQQPGRPVLLARPYMASFRAGNFVFIAIAKHAR